MDLKLLSIIVAIFGISLLLLLALVIPPQRVSSQSELKENAYVSTSGKVISERNYSDFSILRLDNNITATCNCKGFINKTIELQGRVEIYQNSPQININKIKTK